MQAKQVVIIDDDKLVRRLLVRTFEEKGWQSQGAENAEQGFELIKSIKPQLLVLDIFLPGKWSGLELLRILRKDGNFKEMVIVMITAGDPGRYLKLCLEAGAQILIPKPFSPKAFYNQIEDLLRSKEGKNE